MQRLTIDQFDMLNTIDKKKYLRLVDKDNSILYNSLSDVGKRRFEAIFDRMFDNFDRANIALLKKQGKFKWLGK